MTGAIEFRSRRILMTADTLGGVWTYALELARGLQPAGVEVALATMGRRLSRDQRQELTSIKNVEVFESDYQLEWMENPWKDVAKAGDWLLGLESRLKPSLVHLNGYAHAALPWQAPKLVVGHSCVLSWWRAVHREPAPAAWRIYQEAVRAGLRAADLVVAPSHTMLAALKEHYGPIQSARVISNGRNFPLLTQRPKDPFILSVGRLWDEAKNVAALATIAPNLPWPVYLAGDDRKPGGGSIALGHIQYLGPLPQKKLLPWFERASIYALPARYEPFGLSALEAAMAGCALVLGDIPSLREIWGNAALFIPPDDPQALRHALTELIASPAWIATLGAKARWVARRFSTERMAQSYLAAYADLIDRPWLNGGGARGSGRLPGGRACGLGTRPRRKSVRTRRPAGRLSKWEEVGA